MINYLRRQVHGLNEDEIALPELLDHLEGVILLS